jgi:UDP-N-acetylglucosamine--N-acetylmuramyl-(pentapeptide) pyrophosphoryl-undecaprenol N-acetylglucosamine transferase
MSVLYPQRILLAAGGTGGHIYPAIALAEAVLELSPSTQIRYSCGSRPGELQIYRSRGIEPIALPLSGHRRGLVNQARFASELFRAYFAAAKAVREFLPDLAVGFGSYASVPALLAARRRGARIVIHEQNAQPGLANRLFARRADLVLTGIPTVEGAFPPEKTRLTGNPIRKELLAEIDPKLARRELGLPEAGSVCLCFGGSLGASRVNAAVFATIEKLPPDSPWHFLWATGPMDHNRIKERLSGGSVATRATIVPYLNRMDLAYAAADLVIARAGAITLAEITALGKPALLIPLPTAAGGHQLSNARVLEQNGAAIVIEEGDASSVEKISTALSNFRDDCDKLRAMSEAARRLGLPHAARTMAEAIGQLWSPKPAKS